MFATQVLTETSFDNSEEEDTSEIVGYLIIKEKKHEVKKGETKIGRDPSVCLIVIEDFTVSKVHAVIESEGINDTFIYDVGSTNQTKLGKKVLKPHCRYKLDNESKLTFGNIIAKFVLISQKNYNSENFNSVKQLENIFEVPTQVNIPETSTSKISIYEKVPENFHALKIPSIVLSTEAKSSAESLKCVFDEITQCQLDLQKTTSEKILCNNLLENSDIFNLSTQCQLYEAQVQRNECGKKLDNNGSNKNTEVEEIKSLLNDGQDDVLCTFMSLHSPKEQNNDELLKKVKIKTEVEDFSVALDPPIQTPPVIICKSTSQSEINLIDSSNKDFCKDFPGRSLYKPSITSTPLICKNKSTNLNKVSDNSNGCPDLEEENFIKTQESCFEGSKSIKVFENGNNLSQDEETQPYLEEALNSPSSTEQKSNDEDLVLTQTFEIPEIQQNARFINVVPESEDINESEEDFITTQVYDVVKEKAGKEISGKAKTSPHQPSENSDIECNLNENLDFTQRNDQDDFIATQVFEYTSDHENNDKNSERNESDYDEDFIATQVIEIPLSKIQVTKNAQESREESLCQRISPDLLGSKIAHKSTEDINTNQLFDVSKQKIFSTIIVKPNTELTNPHISSRFIKEKNDCNIAQMKKAVTLERSDDETESDLEIILNQDETRKTKECSRTSFKTESESGHNTQSITAELQESDSNSSYVFDLVPKIHTEKNNSCIKQEQQTIVCLSDSDETDCEEILIVESKSSIKEEPLEENEIEETQVLTLSLPDNYEQISDSSDVWMTGRESPKFEIGTGEPEEPGSFVCPELTNPEKALTNNRILENKNGEMEDLQIPSKIKKIEVGITNLVEKSAVTRSERDVESPLKRPLDNNDLDILPIKKSKTDVLKSSSLRSSERQLSKLAQAHDIRQILPSKIRNSLKTLSTKNKTDTSVTNERPSSRRETNPQKESTKKVNGEITSFLSTKKMVTRTTSYKEKMKETFPKENKMEPELIESSSRILRSSRKNKRNSASSILVECPAKNIPIRKSRRNSGKKSEEYFTSSIVNIVFTGFGSESLEEIIFSLGGKKTNDLSYCEVVVADKVRRTVKFLCAIGLGLPITSPEWLLLCKKKQKFLNPWNFILKDEESEEKFNFELKTSLEKSKKVKLLQGFSVFATKNTKPPVKDLLNIVECCGGTPVLHPPDVWPKKTIIVSCLEDKQYWPLPKFRHIKIVHYEFILGGVLRQKIDFNTYKLR